MSFTFEQKLEAVRRELKYRRRVYAKRVKDKAMTQEQADYQIAIFEAIEADYDRAAQKKERLI